MSNKKTGYNFIFDKQTVDISDIGAIAESGAPASFNLRDQGYETSNNNFMFFYTDTADPWKQKTGFNEFYTHSFDIATNNSCPNFKKIISFYGGTDLSSGTTFARKIFERDEQDKAKTYRLRVKRDGNSILILIGEKATNGVPIDYSYRLQPPLNVPLPTALIVGIQAAGGKGGEGSTDSEGSRTIHGGGPGGGAGACCYVVLDWATALKKLISNNKEKDRVASIDDVIFDFYITKIDNWKEIAYPKDTGSTTTCNGNCVTINLKAGWVSSSSSEDIKSKIIIGCGQDAGALLGGKAGIVKNYDLGDANFGVAAGTEYTNSGLSGYGIHVLNMRLHPEADTIENAGNGGGVFGEATAGYSSTHYWLVPTNCSVKESQYSDRESDIYVEQLDKKEGGTGYENKDGNATYAGTGGGGASNYAKGGNGGVIKGVNTSNGSNGTLGSGGGGGYSGSGKGGHGGLPYIFFCSNIDLSVRSADYIRYTTTLDADASAAGSETVIARIEKENDSSVYTNLYPASGYTDSVPYPVGCDKFNTVLALSSGSDGGSWLPKIKMTEVFNQPYWYTYNNTNANPHWCYKITITSI